jgi:hypothetical protein
LVEISKVAKATTNSRSLRVTIPERIVEGLEVNVGDVLIWSIEERKGNKVITIQKLGGN